MTTAPYNRGSSPTVALGPILNRAGAHSFVLCHQIPSFDWRTRCARPHPVGRLDSGQLDQVLEIVGQILGLDPQAAAPLWTGGGLERS